ncbi:uncharacterized protein LOC114339043 isoform X2 [Diabrotica virgifera virgifera]|uniref:Uncharacterized protein n=1 Tax=Diabrotica virgifera virgifera TaxID=50390 RepID=A0ABM5IWK2_DIAVI|nr:uncharacterized protein LOC114339043 isoform X2 [Diabrotica virgifera virgifera]
MASEDMRILSFILLFVVILETTEASSFLLYKPLNTLIKPVEHAHHQRTHHTINQIHKNLLKNVLWDKLLDDQSDDSGISVEAATNVEDGKDGNIPIEDEDKTVELTGKLIEKLADHVKKVNNSILSPQHVKYQNSKSLNKKSKVTQNPKSEST